MSDLRQPLGQPGFRTLSCTLLHILADGLWAY